MAASATRLGHPTTSAASRVRSSEIPRSMPEVQIPRPRAETSSIPQEPKPGATSRIPAIPATTRAPSRADSRWDARWLWISTMATPMGVPARELATEIPPATTSSSFTTMPRLENTATPTAAAPRPQPRDSPGTACIRNSPRRAPPDTRSPSRGLESPRRHLRVR